MGPRCRQPAQCGADAAHDHGADRQRPHADRRQPGRRARRLKRDLIAEGLARRPDIVIPTCRAAGPAANLGRPPAGERRAPALAPLTQEISGIRQRGNGLCGGYRPMTTPSAPPARVSRQEATAAGGR
jgi:hypothetical protein